MRLKFLDLPGAAATGRGSDSARKALEKQRGTKPKPPPAENPPAENKTPPSKPEPKR